MRITRIELTNIKSYAHAAIDLHGGVTAIRGHNGAGKSTLLEAVGWALFNHLPYTQGQFVREGENAGKVTVSFISPLDDREYQVTRRCGSRSDWAIFDPETGLRIDSNADVLDFLRRQMRIEGQISLDELFASALGAPQGTLTSDFLATAANRKRKFDALLQVEDYGNAAKKLSATNTHLKEQIARQEERITGLERESAQLEGWRQAREDRLREQRATAHELDALEGEIERIEALLARLRQAQSDVAQREGAARVAEAAHAAAQQRRDQATRLFVESQQATQTLAETRADHDAYQRAERARALAQRRAQERDALLAERASAAQALERAISDARNARGRLDQIAQAERTVVALQPDIARQTELERARDEARQNVRRLRDTESKLEEQRPRRARLERAIADQQREAQEIEANEPLAAELEERRRRVEGLQALAATREQREQRRIAIAHDLTEVAKKRGEAISEQARQRQNLRKLEGLRPLAERLAELEQAQQAADRAVREIEARLQQNRQARERSGAGACPFLREPCKNIQQRGENSLGDYFDRLIASDEQALAPALEQRAAANDQVTGARTAAEYYRRYDDYRHQLEQAEAQLTEHDITERRLTAEMEDITQTLAAAGDVAGLDEAKRLLQASQDADKRLATLPGVRRALAERIILLGEMDEEQTRLEATRAELASAPDEQRAAEAELARLGDPRAKAAGQSALATARPEVERLLASAESQRGAHEITLARLDESLAPYASLAQETQALDAEITRARPGHTRYLQHEQAAGRLAEREAEHASATASATALAEAARMAVAALAEAQASFDAQALSDATARANDNRSQRGRLRETLRHIEATLAELERQIVHGEELLAELERARIEREELGAAQQMLEQFRETIKEAGPLVTQRLLSQISSQANAIFGEIIGDHAAELLWVRDYEIILRRDGRERTFALLSGGEQMAAALATRLALLRRLTGLDLAFFDEPTQNMDSERRSALAEQIRRVRGFDQLIVISHDDTFEQGLDSVIHLEKRNGVTVVSDDDTALIAATPFGDGIDAGFGLSALLTE